MTGDHMLNVARQIVRKHFSTGTKIGGTVDCEDVVSAGVLRAVKDLPRWNPDNGVSEFSWVYNSILQGMRDYLRNQRPGKRNPVDVMIDSVDRMLQSPDFGPGSGLNILNTLADERVNIEEEVCNTGVREALATLDPKLRVIMHLYFYEDMTQLQIAGVFGVTESRINQLIHKAYGALRPLIAPRI